MTAAVIITTVPSNDKVGIVTTLSFQCNDFMILPSSAGTRAVCIFGVPPPLWYPGSESGGMACTWERSLCAWYWPVSQAPQCTRLISLNAPLWNRNENISVPMWCIVGYWTGVLWDLWEWSIDVEFSLCNHLIQFNFKRLNSLWSGDE